MTTIEQKLAERWFGNQQHQNMGSHSTVSTQKTLVGSFLTE